MDNEAGIEQSGSEGGNRAGIVQSGTGNSATVSQTGTGADNESNVRQIGSDNAALILQQGAGGANLASVLQQGGDANQASISQNYLGALMQRNLATILQDGSRNSAESTSKEPVTRPISNNMVPTIPARSSNPTTIKKPSLSSSAIIIAGTFNSPAQPAGSRLSNGVLAAALA